MPPIEVPKDPTSQPAVATSQPAAATQPAYEPPNLVGISAGGSDLRIGCQVDAATAARVRVLVEVGEMPSPAELRCEIRDARAAFKSWLDHREDAFDEAYKIAKRSIKDAGLPDQEEDRRLDELDKMEDEFEDLQDIWEEAFDRQQACAAHNLGLAGYDSRSNTQKGLETADDALHLGGDAVGWALSEIVPRALDVAGSAVAGDGTTSERARDLARVAEQGGREIGRAGEALGERARLRFYPPENELVPQVYERHRDGRRLNPDEALEQLKRCRLGPPPF
ncbi:MAG: hypothetical protein DCC75_10530 [Proteobacteria bacterium]|nr:MAG: hypothetical protein DCC75_10530 [Pseudomonadota bacterium]